MDALDADSGLIGALDAESALDGPPHARSTSGDGDVQRACTARTATLLTTASDDDGDDVLLSWKTIRLLPRKEVFLEQQSVRDLLTLAGSSTLSSKSIEFVLMLNLKCEDSSPASIARAMVSEAAARGCFEDANVEEIVSSVLANVTLSDSSVESVDESDSRRSVFGQGFYTKRAVVVPHEMVSLSFVRRRFVLLARLSAAMRTLDDSFDSMEEQRRGNVMFVALVLADASETPTKNVFATSHTVASLLSDEQFLNEAMECEDDAAFRAFVHVYVERGQHPTVTFESYPTLSKFSPWKLGAGIVSDIKRRWGSVYWSDWSDAFRDCETVVRCFSTIVWIATTTFIPALSIGLSMQSNSSRRMTHMDFLLSEAFCGIAFALVGGQPLLILRVSGPVKAFLNVLRLLADSIGYDFVAFSSLVGLHAGIMVMCASIFNVAELALCINRFTSENLALFIGVTFVFSGFEAMSTMRGLISDDAGFLKYFVLHLGTVIIAFKILDFRRNASIRMTIRRAVIDLAPLATVLAITGLSYAFPRVPVDRVSDASNDLPTWPTLVTFPDMTPKVYVLAWVAAFAFAMQLVLETNISAMLASRREHKLRKGSAYNWDLFLVGAFTVATALFGLPPSVPALPHSHLHAKLLGKTSETARHGMIRTHVRRATETRVTSFTAHLITLIIAVCFRDSFGRIPIASLSGFLVYMGLSSIQTNSILHRLPFLSSSIVPTRFLRHVPKRFIHSYTIIQLLYFGAVYGCSMTPVPGFAILYPIVLASSVPFSMKVLPRLLGSYHAHVLTTSAQEENMVGLFY